MSFLMWNFYCPGLWLVTALWPDLGLNSRSPIIIHINTTLEGVPGLVYNLKWN